MDFLYKKRNMLFVLLLIASFGLFTQQEVSATHIPPGYVPTVIEPTYTNSCPGGAGPNQTIHGVYPNPSALSSTNRGGSTTLYATSYLCRFASYSTVSSIEIRVESISRYSGAGTMSIGSLPRSLFPGNITNNERFSQSAATATATFSGLDDGENCFAVYFRARASHGGGAQSAWSNLGWWSVCVDYTLIIPPAALYGVKIDNSGVSPSGSSNPPFGGFCGSLRPAPENVSAQCGNVANWPTSHQFTDDGVNVSGVGSDNNNYFGIGNIPPGNHTINIVNTGLVPNAGWIVEGISICRRGATCTSQYLTSNANISFNPTRTFNFQAGAVYDMRIIYKKAVLTCNSVTASVAEPNPGQPFDLNVNFTVQPTTGLAYEVTFANRAGLSYSGPGTYTALAVIGTRTVTFSNVSAPTLGTYNGRFTVRTWLPGYFDYTENCNFTVEVTLKPFFVVRGGDVAASVSNIPAGCQGWGPIISDGSTEAIAAWNNGTSGAGNGGAGTNLAAFSRGRIRGFASAQGRSTFPTSLTGLSYSSIIFGIYGGLLSYSRPCPTDYFDTSNNVATAPIVSGSAVPNTNNAYFATGNFVLNGGAVGAGNRPIIYVDGDVSIESNITLSAPGADISTLSNFYLVVRGNIYIRGTVTQLDGVYVAQPDSGGNKGKIYTCSISLLRLAPTRAQLNGVPPPANPFPSCKTPLTVNGAFIAKELKLYRTSGSLTTNVPAETFNTTPRTWLAAPCAISGCNAKPNGPPYDAITSLPPVL